MTCALTASVGRVSGGKGTVSGLGIGFGDPVAALPVAVPGLFALQLLQKPPVLLVVAVPFGDC